MYSIVLVFQKRSLCNICIHMIHIYDQSIQKGSIKTLTEFIRCQGDDS